MSSPPSSAPSSSPDSPPPGTAPDMSSGVDLFAGKPQITPGMFDPAVAPVQGKPIAYASPHKQDPFARTVEGDARGNLWRNWLFPLIFAAGGWGLITVDALLFHGTASAISVQMHAAIVIGVRTAAVFVPVLLAVPLMGSTIGRLDCFALKLLSIVIVTTALALAVPIAGEWILEPLFAWILLAWFYELDPMEGFILSWVIFGILFCVDLWIGAAAMASIFG